MKNIIKPFAIAMASSGANAITLRQEVSSMLAQQEFDVQVCRQIVQDTYNEQNDDCTDMRNDQSGMMECKREADRQRDEGFRLCDRQEREQRENQEEEEEEDAGEEEANDEEQQEFDVQVCRQDIQDAFNQQNDVCTDMRNDQNGMMECKREADRARDAGFRQCDEKEREHRENQENAQEQDDQEQEDTEEQEPTCTDRVADWYREEHKLCELENDQDGSKQGCLDRIGKERDARTQNCQKNACIENAEFQQEQAKERCDEVEDKAACRKEARKAFMEAKAQCAAPCINAAQQKKAQAIAECNKKDKTEKKQCRKEAQQVFKKEKSECSKVQM